MKTKNLTVLLGIIATAGVTIIYSCKKNESAQSQEKSIALSGLNVSSNLITYANTSTSAETGFEDGLGPFDICTFISPSYGQVITPGLGAAEGTKALKFNWQQSTWDNGGRDSEKDRNRKGVEACSSLRFTKDGWYGCKFLIPSAFPTNRYTIISQGFNPGGCGSWGWILYIQNNQLRLQYRDACTPSGNPDVLISSSIQRDAWKSLIIQWRVSHTNHGKIVVWYANDVYTPSTPTYQDTNINLGYGTWTSDDKIVEKWYMKYGIYASDCVDHVGDGGLRNVYFDNVSQWVDDTAGNGGFDRVNPNN